MSEKNDKKEIKIGNKNYIYEKEEDCLEHIEQMDNKNIKITIKGGTEKSFSDVEKLVIDILGNQYIQRNLENLI